MIHDANRFAEVKRDEMIKCAFLADKYLAELKVYFGIKEHEYSRETIQHLHTVASKLERTIDFIQKHQAQLHRVALAPTAPRLVEVKSYA